ILRRISTRNTAEVQVQSIVVSDSALVHDSVSGAQDRLFLTEPRQRPTETNSRRNVVPVIFVKLFVGVRRVLANRLYAHQLTRHPSRSPDVGKTISGQTE